MPKNVLNSVLFIAAVLIALFWLRSCENGTNPVADIADSATSAIEKTADVAKDAATGTVGLATDAMDGTAKLAKDAAAGSVGMVKDAASGSVDMVKDAGSAVADAGANLTGSVASGTASLLDKLGKFFSFKLPNGVELNIPEFGVENKLIGFISGDAAVDKDKWFEFDRINFQTGSSYLSAESEEQVNNIAAILKAYPNISVKIGGYTDNTGSLAANMRISQARADAVKAAIVAKGVDGARLTTEGYGPAHAVASNDTAEGRAQNRRIAVRVTAK